MCLTEKDGAIRISLAVFLSNLTLPLFLHVVPSVFLLIMYLCCFKQFPSAAPPVRPCYRIVYQH